MMMRWAEISVDAEPQAGDAVSEALRRAGCDGVYMRDTLQMIGWKRAWTLCSLPCKLCLRSVLSARAAN